MHPQIHLRQYFDLHMPARIPRRPAIGLRLSEGFFVEMNDQIQCRIIQDFRGIKNKRLILPLACSITALTAALAAVENPVVADKPGIKLDFGMHLLDRQIQRRTP